MAILKDITLGQYYPGNSFFHRLDPRSKLLASMLFLYALLISSSFTCITFFVIYIAIAVVLSGIPAVVFYRNLKGFSWFLVLTFILHLVLSGEGNVIAVLPYGFQLTTTGVSNALLYTTRLGLLLVTAGLLTLTTTPMELTDGLEKLMSPLRRFKVPVHRIAMMISLSLRFIPLLIQEFERLKNAQISRGASYQGNLVKQGQALIPILMPLFVATFRRSDELAVAMEARCYHPDGCERTSFRALAFESNDIWFLSTSSLIVFVLLFEMM